MPACSNERNSTSTRILRHPLTPLSILVRKPEGALVYAHQNCIPSERFHKVVGLMEAARNYVWSDDWSGEIAENGGSSY